MKKLLVFYFLLLASPAWSQESSTENRWYVLLSDRYFQCAGFLSATSDVLQRRYPELSGKTQEASKDAVARGIISFKREFPEAATDDFIILHFESYFNKYKEIWKHELKTAEDITVANQISACQELLPDFKKSVELKDLIPSLGI